MLLTQILKTNIIQKNLNNKINQARIAADLIELRNKSVFAFFMANALFVLIVFLLQLNKDKLHIVWPLGVKTNITYIEETSEVFIQKKNLIIKLCFVVLIFFLKPVFFLLNSSFSTNKITIQIILFARITYKYFIYIFKKLTNCNCVI